MNEQDIGDKEIENPATNTASVNQTEIDSDGRVQTDTDTTLPDTTTGLQEHVMYRSTHTTEATNHKTETGHTPLSNLTHIAGNRVNEDLTGVNKRYNEAEDTPPGSSDSEEHTLNESFKEAEKQYVYFWKKHDAFSQWHPSTFELDKKKFCCAEQYMMYMKAVLLHDDNLAQRILKCKDPWRIKSLGRQTEQFSEDLWVHNCLHVVKEGNLAKFRQNHKLKEKLFSTYPCVLVEASPYDKVWGIGLDRYEPCAWNEATWDGKNLLGYILTEVRDELMCESKIIEEIDKKVYFERLTHDLKNNLFGRKNPHDRIPRHYRKEFSDDDHSDESTFHVSSDTACQGKQHTEEKPADVDIGNGKGNMMEKQGEKTTMDRELTAVELENIVVEIDESTVKLEGTEMERAEAARKEDIRLGTETSKHADGGQNVFTAERKGETNTFIDMPSEQRVEKEHNHKRNKNEHPRCRNKFETDTDYMCTGALHMKPGEGPREPEYKSPAQSFENS